MVSSHSIAVETPAPGSLTLDLVAELAPGVSMSASSRSSYLGERTAALAVAGGVLPRDEAEIRHHLPGRVDAAPRNEAPWRAPTPRAG